MAVNSSDYKKLEGTTDNYRIIVPQNTDEVKNEGIKLHHCVASYIDLIISGQTKILFMRDKDSLEESLLTLEVRGNTLIQYRGAINRNPNEKEMMALKKWAKKKKLDII